MTETDRHVKGAKPDAASDCSNKEMNEAWMRSAMPGEQHEWLRQFVGTWKAPSRFWMDPSSPPTACDAETTYTLLLGGRWLSNHYTCDFMGSKYEGTGVLGYDNLEREFVSNWMDTMSTQMTVLRGSLSDDRTTLTLRGTSRDPFGALWHNRHVCTIKSVNEHTYMMFRTGANGAEHLSGEINYKRV